MTPDPALQIAIEPHRRWRRRQLKRVVPISIWIVLAVVVLFRAVRGEAGLLALFLAVVTGAALLLFNARESRRSFRQFRAGLAARRRSMEAAGLLHAGDVDGAEAAWRALLDEDQAPMTLSGVVHNLGVAALAAGDPERALALMDHARAGDWMGRWPASRHAASYAQGRAMVCLVLGDLEAAGQALAVAKSGRRPPELVPFVALTELLLALRQGRTNEAGVLAGSFDPALLPAANRSLAAVARGLALAAAGAGREAVAAALEGAPPLPPGKPAWAARWWPELLAFAEEHGRDSASSRSRPGA